MRKRHPHISPTLDLIAKKIFSIPDVTAKFIQEVLDLPIRSVEILEGNQIHEQGFLGDFPFETSVDVRAKLDTGLEVIIEIQVMKQEYFVNRFYYYLANQLIENVRKKRKKGQTHQMYEDLVPVYGIAILEKSIFPDEASPVNVYEVRHAIHGGPLLANSKGSQRHNLLRLAFLELDKYNERRGTQVSDPLQQWLEFFGNHPFSHQPDQVIEQAESLLIPSNWTKEEKDMIDERIRLRENWNMCMETLLKETKEEAGKIALEQGLEQGRMQGLEQGREEATLRIAQELLANGFSTEDVQQYTDLSEEQIEQLKASL